MGAIVCRNGHELHRWPEHVEGGPNSFCPQCGAPAVVRCEACKAEIDPGDVMNFRWSPPAHCGKCGTAYPWTATARESANGLIDMLEGLSDDERTALKGTLDDLAADTPATEIAAMRFKLLARKTGQEGAAALRSIITAVATEAAKKLILGGP